MPHEAEAHFAICREKAMASLVFDHKTRMTPLQMEAVKYMHTKSEK